MSHLQRRDFDDDDRATAVMKDDLVAELTARSRDDDAAALCDAPTKVAKISVAELFAAAGLAPGDAPAASKRVRAVRFPWRRAAGLVLAAALVAMLVVVAQSFGTR